MPKRVDPAVQRRTIASAAIAVIGEVGLEGTRLRDVARAAHVTTGAVMHYFDGKDALLEAALEEAVRRILERQDSARSTDRVADVRTFVRAACTYLPLDPQGLQEWRVWLAFWGRAMADERLRAVHREYYARIVERIMDLLCPLRTLGPAPSRAELQGTADALLAAIDGIGTRATLEPELWPPERQQETLATLLMPLLTASIAGTRAD